MTNSEAIEILKKDMDSISDDKETFRRMYDLHQAEALALVALSNEDKRCNKDNITTYKPGDAVFLKDDNLVAVVLDNYNANAKKYMVFDENGCVRMTAFSELAPIFIQNDISTYFDKMFKELNRIDNLMTIK